MSKALWTSERRLVPLFFIIVFIAGFILKCTEERKNLIWADNEGYYMHLPAWFIHDGYDDLPILTPDMFDAHPNTGIRYNKFTYGVALLQMPFFLVIDVYNRHILGKSLEGFEPTYSRVLVLSTWFYLFIALLYLYRLLTRFARPLDVGLTLLLSVLASTTWFYGNDHAGFSHIYTFALFAFTLERMDFFYRQGRLPWKASLYLGIAAALILLIRPTNVVFLLFLFAYRPPYFTGLDRIQFWKQHWIKLTPWVLCGGILAGIQIAIWSYMSGELTLFSYSNEGFDHWMEPRILRVLFDVQNGLFVYSPIMLVCMYGILRYIDDRDKPCGQYLTVFLAITYIFASWWCWWFGNAYGHRCYVEYMALFCMPLLWVVQHINAKKNIWTMFFLCTDGFIHLL